MLDVESVGSKGLKQMPLSTPPARVLIKSCLELAAPLKAYLNWTVEGD